MSVGGGAAVAGGVAVRRAKNAQLKAPPPRDALPAPRKGVVAKPRPEEDEEEEPGDGTKFGQYVLIERIAAQLEKAATEET